MASGKLVRCCKLLLLTHLTALSLAASTASAAQPAEAADAETSENPADTLAEGNGSAPTSAVEARSAPGKASWMATVDAWFGKLFVVPLATVLFYDFGTRNSLGASVPLVVLWLFIGAVFCTLRMNFINLRGFWLAVRLTKGDFDDASNAGEVSHFQALASALSATVGLGNIAGVAIAVGTGGPGAVFWLVVGGMLGMSSKFAECTLGQMYRKQAPDGTISGGPMHYLGDGLAELGLRPLGSALAMLFAILCIGGSFGGGCAFQVGQSLNAIRQEVPIFDQSPWLYGLLMAVLTAVVIIGGIKRIAATADKIVPFMCGLYVLMSLSILAIHFGKIPAALAEIWNGAMTPSAAYGGFLGVMVTGIRRAAFSNEAGVGSASIAHSAAKTDRPVSEGIVALLEPFIDTVVVCSMTGLVIVITGVWKDPAHAQLVKLDQGAALTMQAVGGVAYPFRYVLCVTVFLFCYSTVISWSYYGERCWTFLFGPRMSLSYRLLFLVFVFLGSIVTATNMKDFSDLMILAMALPNLGGVMLLSGKIKRALDDYWRDYQSGKLEPVGH